MDRTASTAGRAGSRRRSSPAERSHRFGDFLVGQPAIVIEHAIPVEARSRRARVDLAKPLLGNRDTTRSVTRLEPPQAALSRGINANPPNRLITLPQTPQVLRDNARRFDRHDLGLGERSVNLPLDLGQRLDLIPQGKEDRLHPHEANPEPSLENRADMRLAAALRTDKNQQSHSSSMPSISWSYPLPFFHCPAR